MVDLKAPKSYGPTVGNVRSVAAVAVAETGTLPKFDLTSDSLLRSVGLRDSEPLYTTWF